MNKYEKDIQELKKDFEKDVLEYTKKFDVANISADKACHKYNDQVNAINGSRQNLYIEICRLYEFLKRFGNVGISITPFEYVTEDSKFVTQKNAVGSLNYYNNDKYTSNFVKTTAITTTAIFVPTMLPAILIGNTLKKRSESKKALQKMKNNYDEMKISWDNDLIKKNQEVQFYNCATEIANLYRAIIEIVRMTINKTIIPELTGIDAFLVADAIKNCIISDMDPGEADILSIDSYKGTAYDMHYIFVKNVFDYYTMIVKFFTEPILTNIVADNKVTIEEEKTFKMKVNQIEQHTKLLEDTSVFGGTINE